MDITLYFADFQDGKIMKIARKRDQKLYFRGMNFQNLLVLDP